ncbi:MAG TPA: amidohydrolase family protein [bacterium]|nr:amidohydrolase family protein [bacterium]
MRLTIPLLHDNHNHVSLYTALSSCIDLSTMGPDASLAALYSLPHDRLTVVRGWRTNELKLSRDLLSRMPPVMLINFSLHGFAVSDAGRPYLERMVPELLTHADDQRWCEAHVPEIFSGWCELIHFDANRLATSHETLRNLGIGSSDDMTVPTKSIVSACIHSAYFDRISCWVAPELYAKLDIETRKRVSGIKLFLDGAIGARSAAIAGPWIGAGSPMFTYSNDRLHERLLECGSYSTGLAIHAIGELAIDQALGALEKAMKHGARYSRVRLEHVQFIDERQARRAKALGLILSMQPNFSSDTIDYADRLPASYLDRNNPFRMLIDDVGFVPGVDLIFGSDGMPDGIAYAATVSLFPACPVQRLSIDELVAGYGPARGISGSTTIDIDHNAKRVTIVDEKMS